MTQFVNDNLYAVCGVILFADACLFLFLAFITGLMVGIEEQKKRVPAQRPAPSPARLRDPSVDLPSGVVSLD